VFGLGLQELLLVLVIAMLFFGGKKLPEVASGFGKAVREFKRATLEPDTTEATPTSIPTPPTTEDTTSDRPRA